MPISFAAEVLTPWQQNALISLRRDHYAERQGHGGMWKCGKSLIPDRSIRALVNWDAAYVSERCKHVTVRLTKRGKIFCDNLLNHHRGK